MNLQELRARIGRLFITGWDTAELTADFLSFLSSASIGGVILFGEQCTTSDLIRSNLTSIKDRLRHRPLVAIDQEGGRVCRMKGAPAEYKSAWEYGQSQDLELFVAQLTRSAVYLESLGINLLLGPVADIFTNDQNDCLRGRCFGSDPGTVSLFVMQGVTMAREAGLLSCLKHFPGLGDASVDPHIGTAEAGWDYAQWSSRERIPFEDGLSKGADLVMSTHLRLPALDSEIVTGSSKIINELLREELAFDGPLITDDLTMQGADELGDYGDRALKAFVAGHDLLLFGRNWRATKEAYERLIRAFDSGELEPGRLKRSLDRIAALDYKLKQLSVTSNDPR